MPTPRRRLPESRGYRSGPDAAVNQAESEAIRRKLLELGRRVLPFFHAHKNGTNQTVTTSAETVLTFGTEVEDVGAGWVTDTFTAPSSGLYLFEASVYQATAAVAAIHTLNWYQNGSLVKAHDEWDYGVLETSLLVRLSLHDTVQLKINSTADAGGGTYTVDGTISKTWVKGVRLGS
jgi:hypothetical protein